MNRICTVTRCDAPGTLKCDDCGGAFCSGHLTRPDRESTYSHPRICSDCENLRDSESRDRAAENRYIRGEDD